MPCRIQLEPLGSILSVEPGSRLQDILFAEGVEFPCGGRGRCRGCRVKVLKGTLPVTPEDAALLARADLAQGWRLACRAVAQSDLTLEMAQWEPAILGDDTPFTFVPGKGLSAVIDLGTTTLVGQLVDLCNGQVLSVRTALNGQAQHGADIMSRIDFAMRGGQNELQSLIREQIRGMLRELLTSAAERARELEHLVIVGNSVMHHLFCGISVEPLSHVPFEPADTGLHEFSFESLGWTRDSGNAGLALVHPQAVVRFLPCLGGFVGSDILAGILATGLHESETLIGLVDLGTNGEIVIGNSKRMLCASTAAGPAFEGARISMGMRATTGAISQVSVDQDQLRCHVLGNSPARGICGSGLVDAVAAGLDLGRITDSGRFVGEKKLALTETVAVNQRDVRELQLAKGAIAAGIRILLQQWGAEPSELKRLYLAGAFGNYINRGSARRIGLLRFPSDRVEPAGNTALRGAKMSLFELDKAGSYDVLRAKVRHVPLHEDAGFQDLFVEELAFSERP